MPWGPYTDWFRTLQRHSCPLWGAGPESPVPRALSRKWCHISEPSLSHTLRQEGCSRGTVTGEFPEPTLLYPGRQVAEGFSSRHPCFCVQRCPFPGRSEPSCLAAGSPVAHWPTGTPAPADTHKGPRPGALPGKVTAAFKNLFQDEENHGPWKNEKIEGKSDTLWLFETCDTEP